MGCEERRAQVGEAEVGQFDGGVGFGEFGAEVNYVRGNCEREGQSERGFQAVFDGCLGGGVGRGFGVGEDGGGDELVEAAEAEAVEDGVLADEGGDTILTDDELQVLVAPTVRGVAEEKLVAALRRGAGRAIVKADDE